MFKSFIVLCVLVNVKGEEGKWWQIETPQGPVRGLKDPAGLYIFRNIPYATVPLGPKKFGTPGPAPTWLQPIEPSQKSIVCPQAITGYFNLKDTVMHEECLIANIYVPITSETNLPVAVYIHGGAFELGYGDMITPKHFVKQNNVVVVTFNYRLGVHGFLCLGTDDIPGNAGMKDQLALLRWVKNNIASYGGNPVDVTLAGYSAGAMSVHLLMLTKSAQGLFNKVILESGVGTASIAVQRDPLETAKVLARKLNFTGTDDIYALEQFYKNSSVEMLLGGLTFSDNTDATFPFGPCVERDISSAFLSDTLVNIIKKKEYIQLPVLIGFSTLEGSFMFLNFETWKNKMNENFSDFLPADLEFENKVQKEKVAQLVKKIYFGDKIVNKNTIISYIDYFSDVYFVYPILRMVKLHADSGHQQIYLYEYSFVDTDDTPLVPYTQVRGAEHDYQTSAIFDGIGYVGNGTEESHLSEKFKNMKRTMRSLWNNFVRHGKPIPEESSLLQWPAIGADLSPHMSLGEKVELRGSLLNHRARFWDDFYQRYYQDSITTP